MPMFRRFVKWAALAAALTGVLGGLGAAAPATPIARASVADLRREVRAGWHQAYQTPHGTVQVALDIDIPDVTALPVLRVRALPPLGTDAPTDAPWTQRAAFGLAGKHSKRAYAGGVRTLMADGRAEGSPVSPEAAEAILRDGLLAFAGERIVPDLHARSVAYSRPYRMREDFSADLDSPLPGEGYYELTFEQRFYGIPWLLGEGYFADWLAHEAPLPETGAWGQVYDAEDYYVHCKLAAEEGVLLPDVPLATFAQVRRAYEQWIMQGKLRAVYAVRLGYMARRDAATGDCLLVPTWVLYGEAADEQPPEEWSQANAALHRAVAPPDRLAVDAQTAVLLAPDSMAADRTHAPALLGWQQVRRQTMVGSAAP